MINLPRLKLAVQLQCVLSCSWDNKRNEDQADKGCFYYFVRYPMITDKNKAAANGDTGVTLRLRKRMVFTAHLSVFSLLSLQRGR